MVLRQRRQNTSHFNLNFPAQSRLLREKLFPRETAECGTTKALRNHPNRNLPFTIDFTWPLGAPTPLTGHHFLREDFWNLQFGQEGSPSPPLNYLNSNWVRDFTTAPNTFPLGAALGLGCYLQAFSSCDEQGLLSSCTAWSLSVQGFLPCGPRALESTGSQLGTRA